MFFRKVIYLVCYNSIFSLLSALSGPFALLLCLDPLFFSLSLCRCPFLLLGFQSLAVFFCHSPAFFLAFALFFCFFCPFSSFSCPFSFLQTPHNQHFCTHSVRVSCNHLTSRLLLPLCDNRLINNDICSTATRFSSFFKRYFCFSLLFASFLFS